MSATAKAKHVAGAHLPVVVGAYVRLSLDAGVRMEAEVRERVKQGLWAVFETMGTEGRKLLGEELDRPGQGCFEGAGGGVDEVWEVEGELARVGWGCVGWEAWGSRWMGWCLSGCIEPNNHYPTTWSCCDLTHRDMVSSSCRYPEASSPCLILSYVSAWFTLVYSIK